jgi:ribosomal protein S18 acetylase RimI-like enzyme
MEQRITIRYATLADSNFIATIVCMAVGYDTSHPIFPVFEELARHEHSQYSWRNTLIAEVDGVSAGAVVGYDGALLATLREPIFPLIERHLGETPTIEDETEAGEFYLDSVGVLPKYRGLGIGTMLVNAVIDKAFTQGHQRVGLIVDVENHSAEKLYTSLGFEYVGNKRFLGQPMHHLQRRRNM